MPPSVYPCIEAPQFYHPPAYNITHADRFTMTASTCRNFDNTACVRRSDCASAGSVLTGERVYHSLPDTNHVRCSDCALAGPVLTGEQVYHSLKDNSVTMVLGVPTLHASLHEYMHAEGKQLHHPKLAYTAGSPMPARLLQAYQR